MHLDKISFSMLFYHLCYFMLFFSHVIVAKLYCNQKLFRTKYSLIKPYQCFHAALVQSYSATIQKLSEIFCGRGSCPPSHCPRSTTAEIEP